MLPKINLPEFKDTLPVSKIKVKYKPYTAGQQKLLLISRETEDEMEILDAIERITTECSDLDTSNLCAPDFEYLYLKIRAVSEGEKITIQNKHSENPECNFEHIYEVELNNINVTEGTSDNTIMINETVGLTLKYPSISNFRKLKDYESATDMTFFMLKSCIANIFDGESVYNIEDSSEQEISEFFNTLSPTTITAMESFLTSMPEIFLEIEYVCPNCGETIKKDIRQINNFFI